MRARTRTRRLAKDLRRRLTLPEGLLWRAIKARKLDGIHFRKQHPVGPYILDFYCETYRLCIEVDGAGHGAEARTRHDRRRDDWLAGQGVATLRLRAAFVLEDIDGALGMIRSAAAERLAADPLRLVAPRRSTSPGRAGALGEEQADHPT